MAQIWRAVTHDDERYVCVSNIEFRFGTICPGSPKISKRDHRRRSRRLDGVESRRLGQGVSFAIATSESVDYCVMNEDGLCGYAVDRKEWERASPKKKVHVGSKYIDTNGETVKDRIKRAGVRLAHLLNEAFK